MPTEEEQAQEDLMRKQQAEKIALATGAAAYVPPVDRYQGAIQILTNPTDDLYKFELFLRSLKIDNNTGEMIQVGKPLLNERGINSIMSIIQSVIYQTGSMTNYDEKDLSFFFDTLKRDLIHDIMVNRLSYELDRKNRDIVFGNAMRFAWGFLKKSFQEGERRFWRGSVTEIKHTQEINKPQGMSMNPFSYFKKQ